MSIKISYENKIDEHKMEQLPNIRGGASSGGSSAPSDWLASEGEAGYVKNRTHYEEVTEVMGDTLTWDGNTEGLEMCNEGFYLISPTIVALDDLVNGIDYGVTYPDGTTEGGFVDFASIEQSWGVVGTLVTVTFVAIPYDNFALSLGATNLVFPKAGIWAAPMPDGTYTHYITIPGYTGFKTVTTTVKTLDPKYIKDMYYEEVTEVGGDTLTWDGNTEGLVGLGVLWKVSDIVPSVTDLANGGLIAGVLNGETTSYEFTGAEQFMEGMWGIRFHAYHTAIVLVPENVTVSGAPFSDVSAGMYFVNDGNSYITALTIPGYTGFKTTTTTVKTIDPKYLPEGSGGVTSWNDLTDKPFYEDKAFEPIVWDGNTEGKESLDVDGILCYKVSEEYISITSAKQVESIDYRGYKPNGEAAEGTVTLPDRNLNVTEHGWLITGYFLGSDGEYDTGMGVVLPKGVWFGDMSGMTGEIITYAKINPATTVKTLDEKYLPDTVATKADIFGVMEASY